MKSECPFDNPSYEIAMEEPCPVCGALGYWPLRDISGNEVECIDSINEKQEEINNRFIKAYLS